MAAPSPVHLSIIHYMPWITSASDRLLKSISSTLCVWLAAGFIEIAP